MEEERKTPVQYVGVEFGKEFKQSLDATFKQVWDQFSMGRKFPESVTPDRLKSLEKTFKVFFMAGGAASVATFVLGCDDVTIGPANLPPEQRQ